MQLVAWWRVVVSLAGVRLAISYDYSEDDVDFSDNYEQVPDTSPAVELLTRVRRFDSSKEVEDMLKQIFLDRNLNFPTRVMTLHDSKTTLVTYKDNVTHGSSSESLSVLKDTEYPTDDHIMLRMRTQITNHQVRRHSDPVMISEILKRIVVMHKDDATEETRSDFTSSNLEDTDYPTGNVMDAENIMLKMRTRQTIARQVHREKSTIGQALTHHDVKSILVKNKDNMTQGSSSVSSSDLTDTEYPTSDVEDIMLSMRTHQIRDRGALRQATEDTTTLNITTVTTTITTTITTTTTTPPTPLPDYSLVNATVMGKCFVCGLDTVRVPNFAHCADAFAGDFLPLTPVDTRAKGQIANYRKYCRYRDVDHYIMNASQPRSMFGRWTGGCSVRWVDLSGIYTQRSCRNKNRPVLGMHYASKRMAKLELSLMGIDNGCIVSPMATLVPFSRGISLFARFHACVCTGSWCNAGIVNQPSMMPIAILLIINKLLIV